MADERIYSSAVFITMLRRQHLRPILPGDVVFTYLAAVERVRAGEPAFDRGEFVPDIACIALPWRHPGLDLPAVMACMGRPDEVAAREHELVAILRAAVAPGATPRSIAAAAGRA